MKQHQMMPGPSQMSIGIVGLPSKKSVILSRPWGTIHSGMYWWNSSHLFSGEAK